MRTPALLVVAMLGCGGHPGTHPVAPAAAGAYAALQFVPARPTYIVAAPTLGAAQHGLNDLVDELVTVAGFDRAMVGAAITNAVDVDLLSRDAVAALGLDLEGSFAMFSDGLSPTLVAQVAAPDQLQAFFERERGRGLVTQSVIIDGHELFSAALPAGIRISWVVVDHWLWVHVALPFGHDDGTSWFAASHAAAGTASSAWQWATARATHPVLAGFVDVRGLLAVAPAGVAACTRLLEPMGKVGFSIEGELHGGLARLEVDLGGASVRLAGALLPPPPGWSTLAAKAPLAVQWNLDLGAARAWLEPCARAMNADVTMADRLGIRSVRALLTSFDPDDQKGTGAAALDLASRAYLAHQLDSIPFRSHLESDHKFGPFAGHTLSIPTVATVDYVLTDKLALAAIGEGMLDRLVTGTPPAATPPVFAVDAIPEGLSAASWEWLLDAVGIPHPKQVAERLLHWHDLHLAATVDHRSLVVELSGNRR